MMEGHRIALFIFVRGVVQSYPSLGEMSGMTHYQAWDLMNHQNKISQRNLILIGGIGRKIDLKTNTR